MTIHHDESRGTVDATAEQLFAYLDSRARPAGGRITQREAPYRKAWETMRAAPPLLRSYGMGFEIAPGSGRAHRRSHLRVFIDYTLPRRGVAGWLARRFGRAYARRCVERTLSEAVGHFAARPSPLSTNPALGRG